MQKNHHQRTCRQQRDETRCPLLRLKRAFDRLLIIHKETENLYERTTISPELCQLRNIIKVSYIIIKYAMLRKESVGLHYNIDYAENKLAVGK